MTTIKLKPFENSSIYHSHAERKFQPWCRHRLQCAECSWWIPPLAMFSDFYISLNQGILNSSICFRKIFSAFKVSIHLAFADHLHFFVENLKETWIKISGIKNNCLIIVNEPNWKKSSPWHLHLPPCAGCFSDFPPCCPFATQPGANHHHHYVQPCLY